LRDLAELGPEDQKEVRKGIEQFNAGFYFECHDTLEEVWGGLRGGHRDFFQGLIQVSVAFYHLTGGNTAGAASLLERALKRLSRYPDRVYGFDLARHRAELRTWLARIRSGETSTEPFPRWVFEKAPPPEGAP
jgi:predicted metal-dependent hydrolase